MVSSPPNDSNIYFPRTDLIISLNREQIFGVR